MPYNESDDYDVYEIIDQAYNEADRMSRPIHLLLETYQKYEEHDPDADRVADDREALEWLDDYWEYVKWNEHGNESSIDEVGGFRGFARTVTDSDYVDATLEYLIYEDDPELIDPTARDLADRLKIIANRYGALRKMKKGAGIKKYYNIAVRQTSRDDWVYYDAIAGYGDADKSNATRYDDLESAIREKDKLAENFPRSDFAVVDSDGYDAQTFKILVFENPDYMASTKKMKKMSFTERVCQYIKNNYDIPDKMEFYIGTEEYDFKDWVDAYIEEFNNNVSSPYGDDSDENDVEVVGEEILQIMTAPYKMGNEYVINYDDFEASTKKMKKFDKGSWEAIDSIQASFIYEVKKNGTLISEEIDEYPRVDTPQRIAIYEYEGKRYRIFEYNHYPSSMQLIDSYDASTKKSQDIHSMIASIRKNNNSLKKEPVGLNGNWAVSYFDVPTEHGEHLNMIQSNYFSNDVVACYEGTITAYPTSTGTNDLYAQMTYNQDTGEINGYIEWGQYTKNYVPTNARPKSKESLDVFIGEFKQFAEEFTQMIK